MTTTIPQKKMKKLHTFDRKNKSGGALTPHAISDGFSVIGTKISAISDSNNLVRWERNMNDDVSKIVTTKKGNVIVSLTRDRSLSILRGVDGTILISRNVGPKSHEEDGE